ncbi:MAG: acetolactate synthase large subunit [Proteobacteria bacterium]|nr:acetolactate synthase large subunit [Pseudomonadota bacterium]
MNGAESLVRTLLKGNVNVCFTNPGTSEMHFVAALDTNHDMRSILCLFEGGATGAADGYYRMKRSPASTLLHLGPGLANGLANLHNAKKANSGIVNIVGEHAIDHIKLNAPLTSDIEGIARPVSHWVKTSLSSKDIAKDGAEAIAVSMTAPGQIATLILPGDTAWNEGGSEVNVNIEPSLNNVSSQEIELAAKKLKKSKKPMILIGGNALEESNFLNIAKIAEKIGCPIMTDWFNARIDKGQGRINALRIPYVVDKAVSGLKEFDTILIIGAKKPVAFFAYPNKPGILTQESTEFIELAELSDDITEVINSLVDIFDANKIVPSTISQPHLPEIPKGQINTTTMGMVLGALIPENAIVVDESVTTGREFFAQTAGSRPHTWLNNCGGSIGFGLPLATGAAVACPDRKVIALEGDGSAMYTVQSLWTMARENLDITVLIFANQSYKILQGELTNVGVLNPGKAALEMLSLTNPSLNWVSLSKGLGVDAVRVENLESLVESFKYGLKQKGPYLIEVMI